MPPPRKLDPLSSLGAFFGVRAAPRWFEHYVELEAKAAKINIWANSLVPGLFQTEEYARAVIRAAQPMMSDEAFEAGAAMRLQRQSILDLPNPPLIWGVLHEAVVKQPVGNVEITRAQLKRLVELARMPHVNLQILTSTAVELAGCTGPFTMFEIPEQPQVDFAEGRRVGRLIDQKDELSEVSLAYDRLRAAALSPEASIGMIVGAMGQIWIDRT
jgi:hypothetical protein